MLRVELNGGCRFTYETTAFTGVNRIADIVKQDILAVTGFCPGEYTEGEKCKSLVIYGTVGHSLLLDRLEAEGKIDLSGIKNKWETYSFKCIDSPFPNVESALVIAGSDKRGTIYGLFHLSEIIGVSPLINWNHAYPKKKRNVYISSEDDMVSKEPSVKYRGFFINDEWPAFGTWANKHFGGINAKCYEQVFELLLRLKGNYLWPAMWASNFSMDGPGLESARLADEYGVVMSTSHHEPCMRAGEEYGLLRGENSIYGDDWNFRTNEIGITRFWRDGLLRNRAYENVITLGMRGERDSAIMKNEGLEGNVKLLRDVLKTQNQLIRETINEDLSKVPRQMVMFTEVEEFFYGNDEVKGIMDDPELEGVTIMLTDNNFGCTRTLPLGKMREHKGGYGMYYHMDMHGGAYSFQWIGSTYLPRVWEQMTQAYEYGVRDIWVANIGDIGANEYPLCYFLDLAYDIEKWGGEDADIVVRYTEEWVRKNFEGIFPKSGLDSISKIIMNYTGMLAKRKHEVMNADVYHPLHYGEAEEILKISDGILKECDRLNARCIEQGRSAYVSLVSYPACGTANLMKLWILSGRNKLYASQNRIEANDYAERVKECLKHDKEIMEEYRVLDGGKYEGFELSEHLGFTNWNEEDNKLPVLNIVFPANSPRMLVSRADDENYMTGLFWCDRPQVWTDALRPDVDKIVFDISNASEIPFSFTITTDSDWLTVSKKEGKVKIRERIVANIDRSLIKKNSEALIKINSDCPSEAMIKVVAGCPEIPENVFWEMDGIISINAEHFSSKEDVSGAGFKVMKPYGRTGSAIKVFPSTFDYSGSRQPTVSYKVYSAEGGSYETEFMLSPTTPVTFKAEQLIGCSINGGEMMTVNTVREPERPFFQSRQWSDEAINNVKKVVVKAELKKGINEITFSAKSPALVLEKIVLVRKGTKLPESYLGPTESYFLKKTDD